MERSAITPDILLSMTAQQKLERVIRQEKEKLGQQFRAAVTQQVDIEVTHRLERISERWQVEQDRAKQIMNARKGILNKKAYKLILSCLHPDWVVDDKQKARYEDAFNEFNKLEKFLLDEKESPTEFVYIPRTAAEWDEAKRQTSAARRAKRTTAGGIQPAKSQ